MASFNINLDCLGDMDDFNPVRPELVGLPPLDFPKRVDETEEEYKDRQNEALKDVVENYLSIFSGGKPKKLKLIKPQLEFLCDAFFERANKFILVKNRGGGGSLIASIYMWLATVYQGKSCVDIAGSQGQAQQLYEYTKGFWESVPGSERFIMGTGNNKAMTATKTTLINKSYIEAIANSETAARSKHPHVLVCDEACQRDSSKDITLVSALQMPLMHDNYTIIMLSTFHFAGGLFDEYYSTADQKGYKIYSWSTFDTVEQCRAGLDYEDDLENLTTVPIEEGKYTSEEDPLAIESYCKKKCPLSFMRRKIDPETDEEYVEWVGCVGHARHSDGFVKRKNVLDACQMNDRETFLVEHCSGRPSTEGPIYDPDKLKIAYRPTDWSIVKKYEDLYEQNKKDIFSAEILRLQNEGFFGHKMSVGIDWGFRNLMTCVGPIIRRDQERDGYDDVIVTADRGWAGQSTQVLIEYLMFLRAIYGNFKVLADSNNAYGIEDLMNAGFETYSISFNIWKDYGIQNICKYLDKAKLKINKESCYGLHTTLPKYRRDKNGRPVKRDDHYADALLCGMLPFHFEKEFGRGRDEDDELRVMCF